MDSSNSQQPAISNEDLGCHQVEATREHKWLTQLVGEWDYKMVMQAAPGEAPMEMVGRESIRAIGELWTIGELTGDISSAEPGASKDTMIITLGFDKSKGRFVGSFFGSMSDFMWSYDGELSSDNRTLTLNAVGPAMGPDAKPGETANYQDVVELVSPDKYILHNLLQTPAGEWIEFMSGEFNRVR